MGEVGGTLFPFEHGHWSHTTNRGDGNGGSVSISRWSDTAEGSFGKVLHREGAFTIRASTIRPSKFWSSKFPSVIEHECDVNERTGRKTVRETVIEHECDVNERTGRKTVRETWQGTWSAAKYGQCRRCHVKIPDELFSLWKLHNWDELIAWLGAQNEK